MRKLPLFAALAAGAAGAAGSAEASITWDFTYSDLSNTASGTLTTDALSGGSYVITGITGAFDGTTITGLLPDGTPLFGNDNLLYPTGLPFDGSGVAFSLLGGGEENIFAAEGFAIYAFDGTSGYGPGSFNVTQESTVPEPATLGLFGTALAGLALLRRRFTRG